MLARDFVTKLDAFFAQLPKDFSYAVEIRNAGMLGPLYRDMLETHGVAQVYNHWSFMPSLAEQHQKMETLHGAFYRASVTNSTQEPIRRQHLLLPQHPPLVRRQIPDRARRRVGIRCMKNISKR
jgi:hypothetical protein